jgi:protein tyrosine/serine phosphatase
MWKRGNINGLVNQIFSYIDSTLSDHGIFRIFWRSWEELPGKMFRSNQPYPFQIKNDIKKHKIKSIINLRGERHCSSFYLEQDFCHKNNLTLYNFPISSRDLPDKKKLLDFNILLQKIEYPCVMHCKSGADRAGLAAALYLIYQKNYSLLDAKKQLSFKHLHIKYAKTGILDYFFCKVIEQDIKNKLDFLDWIKAKYNKKKHKEDFKVNSLLDLIINIIFRRE